MRVLINWLFVNLLVVATVMVVNLDPAAGEQDRGQWLARTKCWSRRAARPDRPFVVALFGLEPWGRRLRSAPFPYRNHRHVPRPAWACWKRSILASSIGDAGLITRCGFRLNLAGEAVLGASGHPRIGCLTSAIDPKQTLHRLLLFRLMPAADRNTTLVHGAR